MVNNLLTPFLVLTIYISIYLYSALRKDGKRLYELGRQGMDEEDIHIEPRKVEIYNLDLLPTNDNGEGLPCFGLNVECGGGTYIRSLARDIGLSSDTVATMTSLERTKQGVFLTDHCLDQEDWTPENIYDAIEKCKVLLATSSVDETQVV
jgi:tRNA pseudouridine55 synthase